MSQIWSGTTAVRLGSSCNECYERKDIIFILGDYRHTGSEFLKFATVSLSWVAGQSYRTSFGQRRSLTNRCQFYPPSRTDLPGHENSRKRQPNAWKFGRTF